MNTKSLSSLAAILALALAAFNTPAQQLGVPGGFGNQQFQPQRSTASRGTTTYPSSTDIGRARITYDPETRSLIVVSDDDTATNIKSIVQQLDRPVPQVLINCVFLEATYNKGLDLGVQGYYQHTIKGSGVD